MTDFKPGDRVRDVANGDEGVAFGSSRGRVAVDWDAGYQTIIPAESLTPIPEHPIPSEPNTAWVDKDGDLWLVNELGGLLCSATATPGMGLDPKQNVPFTRLVPVGSERDAAIREVVEWVHRVAMDGVSAGAIERHFLSGVDQ